MILHGPPRAVLPDSLACNPYKPQAEGISGIGLNAAVGEGHVRGGVVGFGEPSESSTASSSSSSRSSGSGLSTTSFFMMVSAISLCFCSRLTFFHALDLFAFFGFLLSFPFATPPASHWVRSSLLFLVLPPPAFPWPRLLVRKVEI